MSNFRISQAEGDAIQDWEFEGVSSDGTRRTYVHFLDKELRYAGPYIRKTENIAEGDLLKVNRELLNESHGKRFGDGRVVASIPLNVFYAEFPKRLQEGDRDFVKWFLNHERNRPFRTFRGQI